MNKNKKWKRREMKWKNKWTDNKIGDEGAIAMSESLKTNSTLTSLDLSGNWNATIVTKECDWFFEKQLMKLEMKEQER